MISLIIVTHGSLSKGLLNASTIISGEPTNVFTYSLSPGNSIAEFEKVVKTAIVEKSKNGQVLVLTDIPGGSPTNVTAASMEKLNFECITGANLGMVLEAIVSKESVENFDKYVENVMQAGISSIHNLRKEIGE